MDFFKHFDVVRKKQNYAVTYKRKTLALVSKEVFLNLIVDNTTENFKKLLGLKDSALLKNTASESKAMQLERTYTNARKKFFRNKKIKSFTPKDKDFTHFVKALEIITRHQSSNKQFMDAQIKGLEFAKTFPKPNQLSTLGAEDRLLKFTYDNKAENEVEHIERLRLSQDDRSTPLMENPKFVAAWNKLEKGIASLKEAYFIEDCMIARKEGRVTKKVAEYIKSMESK